jgi:hypothetical protein
MKHTIRLFLVLAALIAGSAGTVQAGTSDLAIVNQVAAADATIKTYVSDAVPTAPPLGTAATTIELGKYLVIEVTPADGKWTYSDLFKIEKGVGIGGAESRPRRANGDMNLGESPTALTTNKADGSGIYYYKIPTSWTDATAVFIHGSVIDKIDLSTATASTDGKTFTTADRTDVWKATIELDEVNFDYNSSTAQGPTISSISVTNGTKTMSTIADHVSISGNSQTNASDSYNATLTAVATGCLTGSVTVPFKIAKASTEITLNTPPGGGAVGQMYIDDTYTILNSFTPAEAGSLTYTLDKESVVTVDASGEVTAVGEGEVTITVSFAGNDNYAAATSKTMKIKVSKVPTEITFDPPYPNTEREGQLNVLDEYGGATLTPAEAGSLTYTYTPDDGSVVTIDNGKIKAVGAGTATITASFAGNNKYAAAVSKTITVNVSLYDASLAFGNVTKTFGDADFTPSPSTKTSDGAITFTSGNTNVITVGSDGKTLNIVAASATPVTITASQAASNSYNATTAEFTVTVNPKTVTVSGITASGKDYDGNTTATLVTTAATFTGIVTGDNLTITATGTFADKNAGKGKTVTLSGLTLGGTHADNYTLATSGNQATTTADINEKTVELEWTNATPYSFNGNAQAPSATVKTASLVSGDVCTVSNYSLAATSGSLTDGKAVNAGSYTITATTLSNSNYKLPTTGTTQEFTISAASATLTIDDITKTYGDAAFTPSPSTKTSDGAITFTSGNTNVITVGSDGKTLSIVGAGEATITASQAANGNYAATSTTFTVTVNPNGISANGLGTGDGINGQIVLSGVPDGGFTYDGQTHVPNVIVLDGKGNKIPSEQYDVSFKDSKGSTVKDPKDADTYTVAITDKTGQGFDNYTVSGETKFIINPTKPQLVFENIIIPFGTYSVTPEAFTKESDGEITLAVEEGETSIQTDGKILTIEYDFEPTSIIDVFTITANQAATKNYTATSTTFTISFSQQDININTHPNVEIHLDGKPQNQVIYIFSDNEWKPAVDITVNGVEIPRKDFNTAYSNNKNVGTASIDVTPNPDAPIRVGGQIQFKIEKADLTIRALKEQKTYGETDPTLSYTIHKGKEDNVETAIFNGVNLIGTLSRKPGENVGEYDIERNTLNLPVADRANYNVTFVGAKFTINPKNVNANGTGTGGGINGKIVLGGVPEGGFTYDGNPHKPTVTVKDGNGNVVPADQYTVIYKDSKGNPVNAPTDADTYTVEIIDKTGTGFDNYTVSGETTFTVKQATLAITAKGQTVTFGTDIATGTDQVTVTGLQGSDALSEIKLTQSTKDVSTNGTITPSQAVIKNGTTDVTTNYSITFNDGQLTITSKGVNADGSPTATGTIELSQESFTYDKQPHKPTVTVKDASGNVIPAEQYNVIYKDSKGQPVTDPTEADTYTVVITDKTGTGFDNYTVTGETTFTINAATATLTFANVTKTFGDAAFTVTPTTDDSKGAITFTSSKTSVITVSGNQLSIVGAGEAIITASQAANGSYNATSTTFTVTVKPKTLTITADAKTKIIGDEDPILTYTSKGLVGTDKISGTLTRDEGEDPGTYAIRQGSLSAGNNYSISYTGANLTIKPEVISITAKNDWFTFSNNRDVTLPDGLTVNTCLLDPTGTKAMYYVVSDDQLTVNGQRVLKGGNGVLLHGKAGTTYKFTVIGTTKVSGNAKSYGATQLIPVIEETHFEKGQIFVLSSNKFVPILDTNTKVPARRAVLWLASGTTAARELTLVDSGTTGITTANSTDATDAWYTLDGRKLDEKPTKKGLYILNGRKVVIR